MTDPETTRPEDDLRARSIEDGAAGGAVSIDSDADAPENEEARQSAGTGRPTREELESKYRQDPRFSMLFDHGKDKDGKKVVRHVVRIGGIRLTPKRIAILSCFLLIMLGCLGACIFFLMKDIDRTVECSKAIALYESGDYATAKDKLIRVLNRDPHKESAIKALADIYHYYGDWGNETFFRQRLVRLNPLSREYLKDYLDSAMRARNYNVIYSLLNLKVLDDEELDPDTAALYLIAALHSDHVSNGKSYYQSLQTTNPGLFAQTDRGRFAEVLLKAERMDPKEAEELFSKLDDIKDPSVRFEVLNMRAYLLSKVPGDENEDKIDAMLKEAAELNNFAGAPILANRYFAQYKFEDAMNVCADYLKNKVNTVMPLVYGESCILSGQPEKIAPMKDRIAGLGGRQSLIIAAYLDALEAFAAGDIVKAKSSLQTSGGMIETPLSSLIGLLIAIQDRSTAEVRLVLGRIMGGQPFMDLQQRARSAALRYLLNEVNGDRMPEPRLLSEYAAIAELIQTPGDDSSFLQRLVLMDRYNRNLLNEEELQAVLDEFPGDAVLLQIAAEYYLLRKQPGRTMEYIEQYRQADPSARQSGMAVLHMLALDQLGRGSDAEAEFRSIVERDPDNGDMLYYYYAYCSEHGYLDSMRELAKRIDRLPSGSSLREFLPFVRAEIQFADGGKKAALDTFETAKTARPDLICHAGDFLAAGGRPEAAIKRYLSVQENAPDKVRLQLKLSRLYREAGDTASAMAHARAAWLEDREDMDARFVYAGFLVADKQYAEAVSVLKLPQYHAPLPDDVVQLWAGAMREQIRGDILNGRYTPAMEGAKHLLIYFPDDQTAKDAIQKIEQIRQNEKQRGVPRSTPSE